MSKLLKQFDKNNFMYIESNNKNQGLNFYALKIFSFSSNLFSLHYLKKPIGLEQIRKKKAHKDHR